MRVDFLNGSYIDVSYPQMASKARIKHGEVECILMEFDVSDYVSRFFKESDIFKGIHNLVGAKKVFFEKALNPDGTLPSVSEEELRSYVEEYISQLLSGYHDTNTTYYRYIGRMDPTTQKMIISPAVKNYVKDKLEPKIVAQIIEKEAQEPEKEVETPEKESEKEPDIPKQQESEKRVDTPKPKTDPETKSTNTIGNSVTTVVDGKEVSYSWNEVGGSKIEYRCPGYGSATFTKEEDKETKKYVRYGWQESADGVTRIRDPKLDKKYEETISARGEKTCINSCPFVNDDGKMVGDYMSKDIFYENGRKRVRKELIQFEDENGQFQSVLRTIVLKNGEMTITNSLNGKKVFEVVQDGSGTIMRGYEEIIGENGERITRVETLGRYGVDGKPSKSFVGIEGARAKSVKTTYMGIEEIPKKETPILGKTTEYDKFLLLMHNGGLPETVTSILDSAIQDTLKPGTDFELFQKAKEKLSQQAKQARAHAGKNATKGDNFEEER